MMTETPDMTDHIDATAFQQAEAANTQPVVTKRFMLTIRKGIIVERADITVRLPNIELANTLGEFLASLLDPSAYLDSVYEIA